MNAKLTTQQANCLQAIRDNIRSSQAVAVMLGKTYDQVHNCYRRLEDRGLVRRLSPGFIGVWELTKEGRAVLTNYMHYGQ